MSKKIIAQNGIPKCFNGEVGKETPFVDVYNKKIFIGDIVLYYPFEYQKDKIVTDVCCGVNFVMEEDTSKQVWTGENHQYIMGIASCKPLYNEDGDCYAWGKKEDGDLWWVKRIKSYKDLVIGEKIGSGVIIEIE